MDRDLKLLLGKLLGEVYRIQRHMNENVNTVSGATIYGLLNGIETVVNEEIKGIGFVSDEQFTSMCNILDSYFYDQSKLDSFRGFYDIEDELKAVGVDRSTAVRILTYLKANDSYLELIEKMDSEFSPIECRKFRLSEWDS